MSVCVCVGGWYDVDAELYHTLLFPIDTNLINICNYFCELSVWRSDSIKCDLTIPAIMKPDPALPVLDQYTVALTAANISEGAWDDGATNIGLNVNVPDRSKCKDFYYTHFYLFNRQ